MKEVKPGFYLAQHLWRTDAEGKPLVDTISVSVWKHMVSFRGEDPRTDSGHTVDIPKQGWILIDPDSLKKPKAAVEAEAKAKEEEEAAEASDSDSEGASSQSTTSRRRNRK